MTDTLYPHDQLIKWVNKEIDRESPWGFTTFCIIFWFVNTYNVLCMMVVFSEMHSRSPITTIGLSIAGFLLMALLAYAVASVIADLVNIIPRRIAIDP